ncbi:MAG: hypothetical protein RI885_275 [Actinomycetota bacterium]|jgi:cysteine desulfurase
MSTLDRLLYLDTAATRPVRPEVLEAMWPHLVGTFGNPSSAHTVGEEAAAVLAEARADLADTVGCRPGDIVFTSGGSESDNLAVKGIALACLRIDRRPGQERRLVVTTPIEHEAVLDSVDHLRRLHGFEVCMLPVDAHGLIDPSDLASALARGNAALVSIAYANNEVGTVQPIAELAAITRAAGIPFHTDAVQAAGVLPLRMDDLGVDALSLSGHKFGTPKGMGLLVVRGRVPIEPLIHGGGQQRGRRSGTENVAAAVGLATALRLAESERAEVAERMTRLRARFTAGVVARVPGVVLTGHPTRRLPGLASMCFPGTSGEAVLLELERRGVVCSSGSACAAGHDGPSPVLLALGVRPEVAQTSVRFSFPTTITEGEVVAAIAAVDQAVLAVTSLSAPRQPAPRQPASR